MKLGSKIIITTIAAVSATLALNGNSIAGLGTPALSAPTLDEFNLLGLAAAVGVAGIIALVRRKK